jgi:predicted amidophosphoribosyltransferase
MTEKRRHDTGAGGSCICPKCGETVPHRRGIRCQEERCPTCGAKLLREGSYHHRLFLEKQAKKRQKGSGSSAGEPS